MLISRARCALSGSAVRDVGLAYVAAAEKMRRRPPGVMRHLVEPPHRVDARESLRRGQLVPARPRRGSRRDARAASRRAPSPRFPTSVSAASASGETRQPIGCGALAQRRFRGDRFRDRLRPAHRLLAELGGAKIVRAAVRRAGRPAFAENLERGARHDRARAACWSGDGARRRSPAAPSVRTGIRAPPSSAAAGSATPRPGLPAPPESEAAIETQSVLERFRDRRAAPPRSPTTGLTSAAGSRLRSSGDSFDGKQPLDEAREPLRRRQQHRDADDIVGGVVGGEQRQCRRPSARGAASAPP